MLLTLISPNLEEMTSFHYTVVLHSFMLYSSPFYTSLAPAQWHSYCLGELSLREGLNPNPPFVRFSPVLCNERKNHKTRGDLHGNSSGLLQHKSFPHFTTSGRNRMGQVWWCIEEVSHLGEWESIQWLRHLYLSLRLSLSRVTASDSLSQEDSICRLNKAWLCLRIFRGLCSKKRCCLVTVWRVRVFCVCVWSRGSKWLMTSSKQQLSFTTLNGNGSLPACVTHLLCVSACE